MLKRTRVSPTPDFARIAAAVSRPGIDPRIWESLAFVRAVVVDPTEGVFVDVTLLPSQVETTARLGATYAGASFGVYLPVAVGDEVLVSAPSGDPAEGMVVAERLWSPSDPPPQEVVDHPEDALIHVKPGKTIRIVVSEGGRILLGGADSSEAVPLGNTLVDALRALVSGNLVGPDGPVYANASWVSQYLDDDSTNILSQKSYTERGS